MNIFRVFLASTAIAGLGAASAIATPTEVSWVDLAPPVAEISNPFEALTREQMNTLARILRLEAAEDQENEADIQSLRANLEVQGLDPDALLEERIRIIEHRMAAASKVNEALIGQEIRIPGYVLPLEFKDRKAVEFLLVPTVGACIHTPPPAPNQLIHVTYPDGIEVTGLYDAVWLTGVIAADNSTQKVTYADGQAWVAVGYSMRPDDVVPYK